MRWMGLRSEASGEELKKAFQAKAFRYHPDGYADSEGSDLHEKLSYLFRRVSDAFANLSSRKQEK